MFLTTRGLVLREVRYKESDKILTVLTQHEGKVTVRARGALRKGSRITAATQLLTYSDMTIFENRGRRTLNEAEEKLADNPQQKKRPAATRAIRAGLRLVDCPIRHLGTEKAHEVYLGIENYLREHGVEMLFGCTCEDVILRDGDIISVDTGAIVDGWVGDNAWTYPVGTVAPEVQRLLEVGERCMWEGLDNARPTKRLGDIGHAVQSLAEAAGYSVVRDYVGHGIGREMHEDPNVPNFGRRRTGLKLLPGMVLAIEPMVNMGTRKVKQCSDGWLVRTRDGKPSVHFEKTVAITEDGPVVLTTEEGHPRPV